jgi:O-antigen/teichoic acid export membrane protein
MDKLIIKKLALKKTSANMLARIESAHFIRKLLSVLKTSPIFYRLMHGTFWSLSGTVASRFFTLIASIFIARILGKEDFGAYAMVQSTLGLFGLIAGFAMGGTMTKYVAELRTTDPKRAGRILSLTRTLSVFTGGIFMVILILIAPWLAETTLKRESLASILITGAVLLFVTTINNVQVGALSGFEAFKQIARINFAQGISTPLLAIPLVYFYGIQGALVAMIIIGILGYVLCSNALLRECRRYNIASRRFVLSAFSEWRVLWKFSLPGMVSGLLVVPVTWISNTILINQKNGYTELGLFNAGNQWRQLVIFIPQILFSVMLPILSDTYGQKDKRIFSDAFSMNFRLTWSIALPFTVMTIVLRNLLSALYGAQYSGVAPIIVIMMTVTFLNIVNNVVGVALASAGRMWAGAALNFFWAIVLIGSSVILTKEYGSLGLALAYLIAYTFHTFTVMTFLEVAIAPEAIRTQRKLIAFTLISLLPACLWGYYSENFHIFEVCFVALAFYPFFSYYFKPFISGTEKATLGSP